MTTLDISRFEPASSTNAKPGAAAGPYASAALDVLLSRQSQWPLTEPGPADAELDLIFDAAMRAPDHGNLRPWRFVTIRGEARGALGDLLVDLASARSPDEPRSAHAHRRQKAFAAPLVIALGAAVSAHPKVPEIEQLLAAGAATMNLLNAIHALGYGGFWATGPDSYEARLHDALGFAPNERLLGFLFVGTAKTPASTPVVRGHRENTRFNTGAAVAPCARARMVAVATRSKLMQAIDARVASSPLRRKRQALACDAAATQSGRRDSWTVSIQEPR